MPFPQLPPPPGLPALPPPPTPGDVLHIIQGAISGGEQAAMQVYEPAPVTQIQNPSGQFFNLAPQSQLVSHQEFMGLVKQTQEQFKNVYGILSHLSSVGGGGGFSSSGGGMDPLMLVLLLGGTGATGASALDSNTLLLLMLAGGMGGMGGGGGYGGGMDPLMLVLLLGGI